MNKRRNRLSSKKALMLVRVHFNLRLIRKRKRKRVDIDVYENAAMADDERDSDDSGEATGSCDSGDSE